MNKISVWTALWITLCFIASMALGVGISYLEMNKTRLNRIHTQLQQAVTSLDVTLSHAQEAAGAATRFVGQTCNNTVLTGLRTIVATVPDVRTINLVRDDMIYCTSVFGVRNFKISVKEYAADKLLLMGGNAITPSRALLVYRSAERNGDGILVGIDGYYLYSILQVLDSDAHLYLKVGDRLLSGLGEVTTLPAGTEDITLRSGLHQYTVIAQHDRTLALRTFFRDGRKSIVLVLCFSLVLTFLFSRYLRYKNTLESLLHTAIKKKQITPWIQPIIDATTDKVAGGEVLLRWHHPTKGYISPEKFIALAEQTGLLEKITRDCFTDVALILQKTPVRVSEPLFICFNVSATQFLDDELVRLCQEFINNVSPEKFRPVLEITEREQIAPGSQVLSVINQLKNLNVPLSLDDFGTGNANYGYIKLFEPSCLKIDKGFTAAAGTEDFSTIIVESILALARKTGCSTVAEGIENEEQKATLRALGVSHFQGYLFSKPLPLAVFIDYLSVHT